MCDASEKMLQRNGVTFFLCGATCDYDLLIGMYFGEKSELVPEANAFAIDGGIVYRVGCTTDGNFWKAAVEYNDSIGSGSDWALAAMDFGKSAKQAVKYAATRDSCTGGKIRVVKV